jgi:hypothetical protein
MLAPTYLSSPLTTLLAANASQHDILDAYHTLSQRLIHARTILPAFDLRLVHILKRDVRRVLVNPLPESRSAVVELTPGDIKRATDQVDVSHAALKFVSLLFRFESLFRLFPGTWLSFSLCSILIYHICSTQPPNTPVLNSLPIPPFSCTDVLQAPPNTKQSQNTCPRRAYTTIPEITTRSPRWSRRGRSRTCFELRFGAYDREWEDN